MNTAKITADAMTRAAQIAINRVKDQIRDEGCKLRYCSISELRKRIAAMLASDQTIIEDAARWCARISARLALITVSTMGRPWVHTAP